MGRSHLSEQLGEKVTDQFHYFYGKDKEEFMHYIDGVTADIRVESSKMLSGEIKAYYYCTVLREGRIFEVWSYGDSRTWYAKH